MQKKGVFPYSFLGSLEKLLPHYSDEWINSLSGQIDISEEDVQHANKICIMFGCKTLVMYPKTDVVLLVDVFEKCRKLFDQVYGLEPCHYYSASNISWDAMLKTTELKLHLHSDIDVLLFCERATLGGLNGIGEKLYMKANNNFSADFDEKNQVSMDFFWLSLNYTVEY